MMTTIMITMATTVDDDDQDNDGDDNDNLDYKRLIKIN